MRAKAAPFVVRKQFPSKSQQASGRNFGLRKNWPKKRFVGRYPGTRGLVSQLAWLDGDAGQRTDFWGLTGTHPFFDLNTRSK
jgi:hypothetical protein